MDLRRNTARLVANKCTLTVRVDAFHEYIDGSYGRYLLKEVERQLERQLDREKHLPLNPLKNLVALEAR